MHCDSQFVVDMFWDVEPVQFLSAAFFAVNGIFGKVLNLASEEVILELITTKCMPILLYGLESCQLSNGDQHSLEFTYN